jgi:transposase InsO family protein
MRYVAITAHRAQFSVALMCRALGVSRAGFYAAGKRAASARSRRDDELRARIRDVHQQSRRTYGSPRVHAELQAQGERCGRKRVARLMRAEGLRVKVRRRCRPQTTDSRHPHPVAENVLARRFAVAEVAAVNRVWAGDITYIPTREGWLYLAVILDLASRRVVGWSMQATLETSLAVAALQMALATRCPGGGLLHHSDRGVQYAALAYQQLLTQCRIVPSMSRRANCYDNAVAESFFATLEWELIDRSNWHTRDEARLAIFEYIECWYNLKRRHSSLGYLSPAQYERQLLRQAA